MVNWKKIEEESKKHTEGNKIAHNRDGLISLFLSALESEDESAVSSGNAKVIIKDKWTFIHFIGKYDKILKTFKVKTKSMIRQICPLFVRRYDEMFKDFEVLYEDSIKLRKQLLEEEKIHRKCRDEIIKLNKEIEKLKKS